MRTLERTPPPEDVPPCEEVPPKQVAPAAAPEGPKKYHPLYYKANKSFAVREGWGQKRQLWSVSNKAASENQLRELASKCCEKLSAGESSDKVKKWAKDHAAKLRLKSSDD